MADPAVSAKYSATPGLEAADSGGRAGPGPVETGIAKMGQGGGNRANVRKIMPKDPWSRSEARRYAARRRYSRSVSDGSQEDPPAGSDVCAGAL